MGMHGRLTVPALTVCLLAAGVGSALAQAPVRQPERVTDLASVSTGQIVGQVVDDAGNPLDGVVVSALGSTSAFAVSDQLGQFSLRQLPPGAYLVRAHRQGYLTVRGTIVEVRPAVRTPSSFTLRREGEAVDPPGHRSREWVPPPSAPSPCPPISSASAARPAWPGVSGA